MEKIDLNIAQDFTPVIQTVYFVRPFAVRKDAPWNTWQEFIKYARDHKGIITIGIWGAADFGWILLKQIEEIEKVEFVYVPFSGPGEIMAALLGGHITANAIASGMFHARSGECKLLMVFTDNRVKSAPDVPTVKELYGLEYAVFGGLLAPKGLPEPILAKIHDAYKKAMDDPDFLKICDKMDLIMSYKNPEEFRKILEKTDNGVRNFMKQK